MSQGNDRYLTRQDVTNHNKIHSDEPKLSSQGYSLPHNAALLDAWYKYGSSKKLIARKVGLSPSTLKRYFNNSLKVPQHRHLSFDLAFSVDVDWLWYERCHKAARAVIEYRKANGGSLTPEIPSPTSQRLKTVSEINSEDVV